MDELVQIAKIFSDKNRVLIIALLQKEKELCVCEICDTLQLSQPLVSRHLKLMREADILQVKQEGKWMYYSLKSQQLLQCLLANSFIETLPLPPLVTCTRK